LFPVANFAAYIFAPAILVTRTIVILKRHRQLGEEGEQIHVLARIQRENVDLGSLQASYSIRRITEEAQSFRATALILLLPRLLLETRLPKQKGVVTFLWYFICLGAGYILIQVALIQKFVLLLGHPTYALVVIVFSMLIASGAGSYSSRGIIADNDGRLVRILAMTAVLVAALAFGARPLTQAAAAWPLPAKMLITVIAIAPAAFLMGMPFPSGLRRLEHFHPPSIRWAWSLNAAASVLGSAGAIFLAIYIGLRATLLVGAALYLCALLVILATKTIRRPA